MYILKIVYDVEPSFGLSSYQNTLSFTFDNREEMMNFAEVAMRHHNEQNLKVEIELIEKGEE